MTKPNTNGAEVPAAELARVVKLKPGSANEVALKAVLPKELYNANIAQIVDYVVNRPELSRKDERIAGRVKHEMREDYGMVANAGPAKGGDNAGGLFKEAQTAGGLKYMELEIIVAAEQVAGYLPR